MRTEDFTVQHTMRFLSNKSNFSKQPLFLITNNMGLTGDDFIALYRITRGQALSGTFRESSAISNTAAANAVTLTNLGPVGATDTWINGNGSAMNSTGFKGVFVGNGANGLVTLGAGTTAAAAAPATLTVTLSGVPGAGGCTIKFKVLFVIVHIFFNSLIFNNNQFSKFLILPFNFFLDNSIFSSKFIYP